RGRSGVPRRTAVGPLPGGRRLRLALSAAGPVTPARILLGALVRPLPLPEGRAPGAPGGALVQHHREGPGCPRRSPPPPRPRLPHPPPRRAPPPPPARRPRAGR